MDEPCTGSMSFRIARRMNSAAAKMGAAALLAACTLAGAASSEATPYLTSSGGCTAAATKALVHQFVGDFNTSRVARIDQLWAPTPRFQWYSTIGAGERLAEPQRIARH